MVINREPYGGSGTLNLCAWLLPPNQLATSWDGVLDWWVSGVLCCWDVFWSFSYGPWGLPLWGVNGFPARALFVRGACYGGLTGAAGDTRVLVLLKGSLSGIGSPGSQLVFGRHCSIVFIPVPQTTVCLASGAPQTLAGIGAGWSGPVWEHAGTVGPRRESNPHGWENSSQQRTAGIYPG